MTTSTLRCMMIDPTGRSRHGYRLRHLNRKYTRTGNQESGQSGYIAAEHVLGALSYTAGGVLALVEVLSEGSQVWDLTYYQSVRVIGAYEWTPADSIALAIFAAEQVLPLFEAARPGDDRPRKAIEAAKEPLGELEVGTPQHARALAPGRAAAHAAAHAALDNAAHSAALAVEFVADAAVVAAIGGDPSYTAITAVKYAHAASVADREAFRARIDEWVLARIASGEITPSAAVA